MGTEAGVKHDDDKGRIFSLLLAYFPRALQAVTQVSEFGATKYCKGGWATVPDGHQRYTDALGRHFVLSSYEEVDPDSGLWHDCHTAWNALAALELRLRGLEGDRDAYKDCATFEHPLSDTANHGC